MFRDRLFLGHTFRRVRIEGFVMGKMNVKNGTPVGSTHLCKSCSWGQYMMGYRESDLLVICTNTSPNIAVPFTVFDCSEFNDKYRPGWEQMEKLAIDIQPTRISTRTAGFNTVTRIQPIRRISDDEDEGEVARVR
jgi:hypothetical protein